MKTVRIGYKKERWEYSYHRSPSWRWGDLPGLWSRSGEMQRAQGSAWICLGISDSSWLGRYSRPQASWWHHRWKVHPHPCLDQLAFVNTITVHNCTHLQRDASRILFVFTIVLWFNVCVFGNAEALLPFAFRRNRFRFRSSCRSFLFNIWLIQYIKDIIKPDTYLPLSSFTLNSNSGVNGFDFLLHNDYTWFNINGNISVWCMITHLLSQKALWWIRHQRNTPLHSAQQFEHHGESSSLQWCNPIWLHSTTRGPRHHIYPNLSRSHDQIHFHNE